MNADSPFAIRAIEAEYLHTQLRNDRQIARENRIIRSQ
jgi:hypothetical protein